MDSAVSINWIEWRGPSPELGNEKPRELIARALSKIRETYYHQQIIYLLPPVYFSRPPQYAPPKGWVNCTTCSKFNMEYSTRILFTRSLGYIRDIDDWWMPLENYMFLTGSCKPKASHPDRQHRIGKSVVMVPSAAVWRRAKNKRMMAIWMKGFSTRAVIVAAVSLNRIGCGMLENLEVVDH
jgi:hypothetical protein